jgi:Tfp pilus assembly protein PilO
MKSVFETLNLSPAERRLVVGVLVVVFVFLNFWLVWPHFDDWKQMQVSLADARRQLDHYETDSALRPLLQKQLERLEDRSLVLPSADQAIELDRTISRLARENNVIVGGRNYTTPGRGQNETNVFFEEKVVRTDITATDASLVSFLYSLGASNSMIRVSDMLIRPGSTQTNLAGSVTLVASFQRETALSLPAPNP